MKFCIITHVDHYQDKEGYFAYAPYVREMNLWFKYVDTVVVVAPLTKQQKTVLDIKYEHPSIDFRKVSPFDATSVKRAFKTLLILPGIMITIYKAMKEADHIHLRSAGNMSLLGSLVQIFFPKKKKTAKYAGNWDPKAEETFSITFQKWLLNNTFLTRNMQVMVYGEWEKSSKNVKPLFTATYTDSELRASEVEEKKVNYYDDRFNISKERLTRFLFVGTLTFRKRPLYAIDLIHKLKERGYNVHLHFIGEGESRATIENYINSNDLQNYITLEGNKSKDEVAQFFRTSEFVLLPSKIEGWPKAVAEGMFWGCVPLATPISAVPYMVDKGNRGILLNLNLEDDANQIVSLVDDNERYKTIAVKACNWSRNYTMEKFEEEIKKLLA